MPETATETVVAPVSNVVVQNGHWRENEYVASGIYYRGDPESTDPYNWGAKCPVVRGQVPLAKLEIYSPGRRPVPPFTEDDREHFMTAVFQWMEAHPYRKAE